MAKNAVLDVGTRRLVATEEDQEHHKFLEDSTSTRKFVASGNSETEGSDKFWPHDLHISTTYVPHMEKVFSIVRQRYGLSPMDQMKNLDVNTAKWSILMSVTFQAAVHLGTDYTENVRSTKNQHKKSLRQFKWLRGWSLTRPKLLDLQPLIGSSLCGERRFCYLAELFNLQLPKTTFFSESVLCLGGISDEPVKAWESRIKWVFGNTLSTENKWSSSEKILQDSLHCEFSTRLKRWWLNQSVNQSNLKEGTSSCQCTMTLIGKNDETKTIVLRMFSELLSMLDGSRKDIGRFQDLDPGRNGTEPMSTNQMENG